MYFYLKYLERLTISLITLGFNNPVRYTFRNRIYYEKIIKIYVTPSPYFANNNH